METKTVTNPEPQKEATKWLQSARKAWKKRSTIRNMCTDSQWKLELSVCSSADLDIFERYMRYICSFDHIDRHRS